MAKNHVKVYFDSIGETPQPAWTCEMCGQVAVDFHHIEPKGMGGSKLKDYPENLIALCRDCHDKAGESRLSKEELKAIARQRYEA